MIVEIIIIGSVLGGAALVGGTAVGGYILFKKLRKKLVLDQMFIVTKPDGIADDVVHQDMTQPLSHYWIAASHNTYLTGAQFCSFSSLHGYKHALNMGARVIEVDCWDGKEASDEPIVKHGYFFTTFLPLREVVETIKEYAFVTSKYPIILSIEDHTKKHTKEVVNVLKQVLGEALYTREDDEDNLSPHQLREHFIPIYSASVNDLPGRESPLHEIKLNKLIDHDGEDSHVVLNFSEKKIRKFAHDNGKENLMNWVREGMCRVYPAGYRIFSGNFDPQQHWKQGVQIVALNYQTEDKHLRIYQEMFKQNGKCGYILKPNLL